MLTCCEEGTSSDEDIAGAEISPQSSGYELTALGNSPVRSYVDVDSGAMWIEETKDKKNPWTQRWAIFMRSKIQHNQARL